MLPIDMKIEYDSSKEDVVLAQSQQDAVKEFRKKMDEKEQPYCGIVATEKKKIEDPEDKNLFVMKSINIDSIEK